MRLKIGGRLYALLIVFAVGCVIVAASLIWMQNSRSLEARHRELGELVDVAVGVLDAHRQLAVSGAMSEAEAKQRALSVVSAAHYGHGEYYFVMDENMVMMASPGTPQLVGKSLVDLKDMNGFAFLREMQRQIKISGIANVSYFWNKPGSEALIRKISVAKLYRPWRLVVGTGVYSDDLMAELWTTIIQASLVTMSLLVAFALLAFLTTRSIVRPIARLVFGAEALAGGDTTVTFDTTRHDEIGEVAGAVAKFRDNVIEQQRVAAQLADEVTEREERNHRIEQAVERFRLSVDQVLSEVGQNASAMRDTAKALRGISADASKQAVAASATSEETANNVQAVASASEELTGSIQEIGRQVHQATEVVRRTGAATEASAAEIEALAAAGQRIGAVVDLIQAIAAQTNLLALNATIEAARAGEAGRGFAVVAQEVKSLAGQTAKATEEIAQQVSGIQTSTKTAVEAARNVAGSMKEIDHVTTTIAGAIEEQGSATREIAENVQMASRGTIALAENISTVNGAIGETHRSAETVLAASEKVGTAAERLADEVESFFLALRTGPMDRRVADDPNYRGPERRHDHAGLRQSAAATSRAA
jgi:methyl-accepting chemotaxis protein